VTSVAILYICTGAYDVFWKDFYDSVETKFLPSIEKHYFVFTDSKKIENSDHIHLIFQERLPWPYPTLFRFKMFNKLHEDLNEFDFIFFMNANLLVIEMVGEEILPYAQGLSAVLHPGFYAENNPDKYTYDRNPRSLAYIPFGQGCRYFMGGFNGGRAKDFLKMCDTLNRNVDLDLSKGIIALWHDESHLNRYMLNRDPLILTPAYGYPEGWKLPFSPKIIIRDKNRFGGHDALRGITTSRKTRAVLVPRIRHIIRRILKKK